MVHVVKRTNGQTQSFDPEKLFRSLYSAALSAQAPPGEAQLTAHRVYNDIHPWLEKKPEITSNDIRRKAGEELKKYNPHAAYMYGNQNHPTRSDPRYNNPSTPTQGYRPSWLDIGKKGHWDD